MTNDVLSRRLAVIVAADVVGYSRLMEADESGTLAQLKSIRKELIDPKISEHRGRLVKTTGDGLLMEFFSVTDGVHGAIEIQEAMAERNAAVPADRRLQFRIGINLGEIITEGEDIYGTGVNVAARLEALAEPGGICVSASVHEQIQSLQGLGFEDLGEQLVKNMSRPVRSFALRTSSSNPIAYQRVSRSQFNERSDEDGATHRRMVPSIAVLPFTNLSGDAEQEYFADGIAEDIITALSKISNLLVISRNSTFAYKGKAVDAHAVGRELNVRYVLEGSVRKAGGRVRITAQLVEALGRQQLWAVRFDRELSDIFALQDEITSNVVAALQLKLVEGEQARVWHRGTKNFEAWECLMQGLQLFRHFTKDDNAKARVLFRRSLELDPNYAVGLVWLAWTYWSEARFHWTATPEDALNHADELARCASAIDDNLSEGQALLGAIYLMKKSYEEAIAHGRRSIEIEPNAADATATLAMTLSWCGRPAEAVELVKRAMRLSPIHSAWYLAVFAHAYRLMLRYDEAVDVYKQAIALAPNQIAAHLGLTICYAQTGQIELARVQGREILRVSPKFDMALYAKSLTYQDPEDSRRSLDALAKAFAPVAVIRSAAAA
jgi:adenylate cyclase